MFGRDRPTKVSEVENEERYGYVYGVSGPGMIIERRELQLRID